MNPSNTNTNTTTNTTSQPPPSQSLSTTTTNLSPPPTPSVVPPNKRPRTNATTTTTQPQYFVPSQIAPHTAEAATVSVLHQVTHLSWLFSSETKQWYGEGKTILFVIHHGQSSAPVPTNVTNNSNNNNNNNMVPMALHLRGCVDVQDVKVEAMMMLRKPNNNNHPTTTTTTNTKKGSGGGGGGGGGWSVALQARPCTVLHADPLEHVLWKPAASYHNGSELEERGQADAQCSRGAAGMTNALRAASIASWQGELRLRYERPPELVVMSRSEQATGTATTTTTTRGSTSVLSSQPQQQQQMERAWKTALCQEYRVASGSAKSKMQAKLRQEREAAQYQARIKLCSQRLAAASCGQTTATATAANPKSNHNPTINNNNNTTANNNNNALRLTIKFRLPPHRNGTGPPYHPPPPPQQHYGGLHILTTHPPGGSSSSSNHVMTPTPHIYTTSGVYGDHEGPRCWVPCLDSASTKHRCSHEFTVSVTAGLRHGLSTVGMGQDWGWQQSYLHVASSLLFSQQQPPPQPSSATSTTTTNNNNNNLTSQPPPQPQKSDKEAALLLLGGDHMTFLQRIHQMEQQQQQQPPPPPPSNAPHIIPPDSTTTTTTVLSGSLSAHSVLSLKDVSVTSIWCSATWSPVPIRSLGFAIGPFRILEDTEYFGLSAALAARNDDDDNDDDNKDSDDDDNDDDEDENGDQKRKRKKNGETDDENMNEEDAEEEGNNNGNKNSKANAMDVENTDDDDDSDSDNPDSSHNRNNNNKSWEETQARYIQSARERGEGIRQAYLAPVFLRKHLHASTASRVLLPNHSARLALRDLTNAQKILLHQLDQTVQSATVGVPHRALSLMRDLLAVPSYRTSSYTQVWIPQAVHGGCTSGSLHQCPEVMVNPFLGGAIIDARLLPPVQTRLPYYSSGGGRVLQFLQARNAVRGWITASLPLGGGNDDVGHSYILRLLEALMMSCYERGHGAFGEGGAPGSVFHTRRYAAYSGLNSTNLDFLPIRNLWDDSMMMMMMMDANGGGGGGGGMMMDGDFIPGVAPIDETQNDYLWRSATNGTESHTSGIDEFNVRHFLRKDVIEVVERGTDKDKQVPSPGMGWGGVFGSYLSSTFLSSNASSSSLLGCGAVEMMHPLGGLTYRAMKMDVFRGVVEGRAGISNFLRLARASFVAAHLADIGQKTLVLPKRPESKKCSHKESQQQQQQRDGAAPGKEEEDVPPFVVCVNEILTKGGLTHTLFTRALQNMSGRHREPYLAGTLVDVERDAQDPRTRKSFVDPEGFPNSFVRAATMLYCRVGVQVEQHSRDATGSTGVASSAAANKSTQCQIYAEPIIPEGGVAFGGPITVRVVENEGQFKEYEKDLAVDGSRRDWGSMALHAKPVSTPQVQASASGAIESKGSKGGSDRMSNTGGAFTNSSFHGGGFQAIELVRLTNLTPLLWLFHDGDASAQVDAIRSLAERPLRIQVSLKVSVIHGVNVAELPVRLLSDCLKGSSALHSSLPHTPCVRSHAALAIAQWQNNKGPSSKNAVGADSWLGLNLLIEYFQERFNSNSIVMPVKFARVAVKNSEAEARAAANAMEGGGAGAKPNPDESLYDYLDTLDEGEERNTALDRAEDVETEEDEEYRVRSACVTAIASIRAQDGHTPDAVIQFMESVLEAEDASMVPNVICPDDETMAEQNFRRMKEERAKKGGAANGVDDDIDYVPAPSFPYYSGMVVADTLLATCHINAWPAVYTDPTTGTSIQGSGKHPVAKLIELAQCWLEWELYREKIRAENVEKETLTVIGGNCYDVVAACAIVALANLAILRQCTTIPTTPKSTDDADTEEPVDPVTTAQYYANILELKPARNDLTRAAAAQALTCICCAADRFEVDSAPAVGLLCSLEILLDNIAHEDTSPSLRQTLAQIMMDACTGKVCSMQRVGAIAGRNELYAAASRFFCGPLGTSHGGDNGSAMLTTVSAASSPAASAVNDGARRGLKLLNRAGHPRGDAVGRDVVVRVAIFATRLWRIINGEPPEPSKVATTKGSFQSRLGVCAYDGSLRCSLLCLWLWLWPKGCFAVLQVQSWKSLENTPEYRALGAHRVMKITEAEKAGAILEENSLSELSRLVQMEMDRQAWRGEMATKSYSLFKSGGGGAGSTASGSGPMSEGAAAAAAEQGIGQPLPPIQRDAAFKQGGWIASAAQQRRAVALDGGTAVTKLRLKVGSSTAGANGGSIK
ncbi:hypothetical protein ACA910_002244 [Epithemia clementina (nom. ined.)]